MKKTQIELCGLWKKIDKNGNEFFAGNLGGVSVMIFRNTYKETEKQPDFKMYVVERDHEQKPKPDSDEIPF